MDIVNNDEDIKYFVIIFYTLKLKSVKDLYFRLRDIFFALTHFQQMFHFYTSWKHQKTGGFLMLSGNIEVEHWLKMG